MAFSHAGGVSVLAAGSTRFEEIKGTANDRRWFVEQLAVLPRRHLTVVLDGAGTVWRVDGMTLKPWLSADNLQAQGIHGIRRLFDSPSLSAIVVIDANNNLHVLADDDRWFRPGSPGNASHRYLVDSPSIGGALLFTDQNVLVVRKGSTPGTTGFVSEILGRGHFNVAGAVHVSRLLDRVIAY